MKAGSLLIPILEETLEPALAEPRADNSSLIGVGATEGDLDLDALLLGNLGLVAFAEPGSGSSSG